MRNGVFPSISVNKGVTVVGVSQSSVIVAIQCELVNPEELRKEKNTHHLAAIRFQPSLC